MRRVEGFAMRGGTDELWVLTSELSQSGDGLAGSVGVFDSGGEGSSLFAVLELVLVPFEEGSGVVAEAGVTPPAFGRTWTALAVAASRRTVFEANQLVAGSRSMGRRRRSASRRRGSSSGAKVDYCAIALLGPGCVAQEDVLNDSVGGVCNGG